MPRLGRRAEHAGTLRALRRRETQTDGTGKPARCTFLFWKLKVVLHVSGYGLDKSIFFSLLLVLGLSGPAALAEGLGEIQAAPAVESDLTVIEIDSPEFEAVTTKDLALELPVGSSKFLLEIGKETNLRPFTGLPEEEKQMFLLKRQRFLEACAKGLGLTKYGIGFGAVTKDKITYLIKRTPARQTPLRERAEDIIRGMLASIDRQIFDSAPVIARANEFGIMLAGGVEALGGSYGKGGGGILDLGISIGYNVDNKALVIQIFRDVETYQSSISKWVGLAGAVMKAGPYAANMRAGQLSENGTSFYPPMVPGFQMKAENFVAFGFSTGLTWPPSPLGDLLTYTTRLDHSRLLRITVSPLLLGFVRVSTTLPGSIVRDFRMALESIPKLIELIHRTAKHGTAVMLDWMKRPFPPRPACRTLFTQRAVTSLAI